MTDHTELPLELRVCTIDGCERQVARRGYCNAHYIRVRRYGEPGPAEVKRYPRRTTCSVDGCLRPHDARGLCGIHYAARTAIGECSIEVCARRAFARTYCRQHYLRWRSNGDPGSTAIQPRNKEIVGYVGAHYRVRAVKGNARDYPCRECGGVAEDWAYLNNDPAEILDGDGRRYSLDPDRYVPMCERCHSRFDAFIRLCDIDGCGQRHSGLGYCRPHYNLLVAGPRAKQHRRRLRELKSRAA